MAPVSQAGIIHSKAADYPCCSANLHRAAYVVTVCVPLDANAAPKLASPVATNPSSAPLLPVPRF